jgi:hypothetical protein
VLVPSLEVFVTRPSRAAATGGLLAGGLLALALPAVPASAQAAPAPVGAQLTVVHGVRGLVADVRLDDQLVLSGFAPERVTDPLTVPAGTHRVQVWPTGAATSTPPVIDQTVTLTDGQVVTAGVGLGPDGPQITLFDDAGLLPDSGSTALAVRGLADSEPVTVRAAERTVAEGLASGQQQVQQVAPGTYPVTVTPGAGGAPLVPAQDVPVVAGRAVVLYLIGSQRESTLGWVAQTVRPGAAAAPLRVDTGSGPVPAAGDASTTAAVLGLPTAVLAAVALRRRRPAAS